MTARRQSYPRYYEGGHHHLYRPKTLLIHNHQLQYEHQKSVQKLLLLKERVLYHSRISNQTRTLKPRLRKRLRIGKGSQVRQRAQATMLQSRDRNGVKSLLQLDQEVLEGGLYPLTIPLPIPEKISTLLS